MHTTSPGAHLGNRLTRKDSLLLCRATESILMIKGELISGVNTKEINDELRFSGNASLEHASYIRKMADATPKEQSSCRTQSRR